MTAPQLAALLRGRAHRVHNDELPGAAQEMFRQLVAERVLDRHGSIYQASPETLYSVYQRLVPPLPLLTPNDRNH